MRRWVYRLVSFVGVVLFPGSPHTLASGLLAASHRSPTATSSERDARHPTRPHLHIANRFSHPRWHRSNSGWPASPLSVLTS